MSAVQPWVTDPANASADAPQFTQADIDAAKEHLLSRFRHFAAATMDRYSPVPNDEMADEMEKCIPDIGVGTRRKRKLYLCSRNTFKTTLVARLIAFCVLKFPGIRIAIGRAKHDEARAILFEVKAVLLSEGIIRIFGDLEKEAGIWNEDQINLGERKEPTVGTFGLDVSMTGQHVDMAFVDDIINDKNYRSEIILDQAKLVIKALSPVLEPWGSFLVTGTRWSTRDVYGWILSEVDEDVKKGLEPLWSVYIRKARNPDGSLFFPTRLSAKFLEDEKRSLRSDPRLYAAWYDNQPYDDETKLFKPEYLTDCWFTADFQSEPYPCLEVYVFDEDGRDTGKRTLIPVEVTMSVDPAPTVSRRSDFTGVTVVAMDANKVWWVLIARAYKATPSVVGERIIEWVSMFKPRTLLIESAQADVKMVERVTHGIRDLGVRTTIQSYAALRDEKAGERGKGARIGSLEPLFRFKEIRLQRDACDALLEEYDKWEATGNSHDDVLDALAMQFKVVQPSTVKTVEEAERQFYKYTEDDDEESREVAAEAHAGLAVIARTGRSTQVLRTA